MPSRFAVSKTVILIVIAAALVLPIALYLNKASEKWVPEADAKVKAFQQKQAEKAIDDLQKAATEHPTSVEAQLNYARALTDKGLFVKALIPAGLAVKVDPRSPEAHLLLAEICAPLDYREEAIQQYKEALKLDPNLNEAYQHLGDLLMATGKTAEAESLFRTAHDRNPESPGPLLSLAEIYTQQGLSAKAAKTLDPLMKLPDPPVAALYLYGKAANAVGQSSIGTEKLQLAIKKAPDFADAHNALGSALANQTKFEEAIKELKRSIEISPDNSSYQYELAKAYLLDNSLPNHLELAKGVFEQSLEKDPSNQWAHYYYGMTLEQQGDDDSAAREYRRVLELNKEFASGYYRLGAIYKRMGRIEEGKKLQAYFDKKNREAITTVHGQRRDNSEVDNAEYRYQRGIKALKAGKKSQAISEFQAALDRNPNHAAAKRQLADLKK